MTERNNRVIARRYAQAYYNIFGSSITFVAFQAIQSAEQFLHEHKEFISWLKVPAMPDEVKHKVLVQLLLKKYAGPSSLEQLIRVLIQDNRSYLIGLTLQEIADIYQERSGLHLFTVSSSHALSQEDVAVLENFLKQKKTGAVLYRQVVDKDLIAGICMQSNLELWEYSVRKDLRAIELSLKK
ncbi:MAG: ATP synthase F1 subunit delta [Candidatus Dependentiae bacterium]